MVSVCGTAGTAAAMAGGAAVAHVHGYRNHRANSFMQAWIVGIWLFLFFIIAPIVSHADLMTNATVGNLTSPVDTNILLEHRLYDVVWGNGLFVAVGQSGFDETEVLLSPDGAAWERVSLGKPARPLGVSGDGVGALYGITWNGSVFVAVGERILTSTDGKSWTVVATFSPCSFSRVQARGSMFVAVGDDRGRGCLATSTDGEKWTDQTAALESNNAVLTSVFSTDSGFLVIGNANLGRFGLSSIFLTSSTGKSWSHQPGPQDFLVDVTGNGSEFVAVGGLTHKGVVLVSPDAQEWTPSSANLQKPLRAVIWNGALFVAVGARGAIVTSADSKTWTERPSGVMQDLLGVAWNGRTFVSVGEGAILTSPDGMHWQEPRGMRSVH